MIPGPAWLADLAAAGFVVVALYCATSLVLRGLPWTRTSTAEVNHVLMALAMAAMVLPAGASLVPAGVSTVVFGAAGIGWLLDAVVRRRRGRRLGLPVGAPCAAHPVHLAVLDAAMVAMDLAMRPSGSTTAMPGMDGMAGHVAPAGLAPSLLVVAAGLTVYLAGHALAGTVVVGTMRAAPVGGAGIGVLRRATSSPRAQTGCQVLMSLSMAGMLVLVL